MKEKKSTKSSIDSLTGRFMKFSKVILFIALFCVSVFVARATPIDVTASPYNAVGNDIADDRIPIQNAINAASGTGNTVYFPPGFYRVSGTIYVPSNVRLQGTGSTVYNTQIRLTPTHTALFEIVENGATNIVFKDLTLSAVSSPVWPRSSSTETALIRAEGTTAISFKAAKRGISNIVIENVRTTMFTYGISATSSSLSSNYAITDFKIRNYVSDGNEYSLYTRTKGINNWDVQNMNVYPMYAEQNGIFLERSGAIRFLQLSCAGAGAGICAKLWDNGELYFRQMHVEGARLGICAGGNCDPTAPSEEPVAENSSKITIENSATDGEFNRFTNLVSINNRFWLDFPLPPLPTPTSYRFYGTGTTSALRSCGNVWISWHPATHMSNTTVIPPAGTFPGLTTTGTPTPYHEYQQCLRSDLTSVPVFNTGYEPDTDRFTGDIDVTSAPYYAVPNDGIDDTAAFQQALKDAAASSNRGRRIFVPAGTFEISSTLELKPKPGYPIHDGMTILGETGSILHLTGTNLSLIKILNGVGSPVHGITLRNLTLTSNSTVGTYGVNFENWDTTILGAASDFQIQNVDFQGFEAGIVVRPVNGILSNGNPMFDSVSIKDADFSGNKTAILTRSANASSWNLEDIRVDITNGGEGVRIDNGGVSIRNLSCVGGGIGTACLTIQRQGVVPVENLTATGVIKAMVVRWENGWTQFPVSVRNSDLREGVYFQGRTYLNSVNNFYPASIETVIPKEVRFGAYIEGDPWNVAYGGQSDVFSCDDTFTDGIATQPTWAYSGTLLKPITYCY